MVNLICFSVSVFLVPIPDLKSEHVNTAPGSVPRSLPLDSSPVVQPLILISSPDNHATHSSPVHSPDGRFVAYLAMARAQYESDRFEVTLYDRATQSVTYPSRHIDMSFGSLLFDPSVENGIYSLYCTAQYRGSTRVYQLNIQQDGSFCSLGVMPGEESRNSPVVVVNRTGPRALYFFESSLGNNNPVCVFNFVQTEVICLPHETCA